MAGQGQDQEVVVGLDNGGRAINATVLDSAGQFLVDQLVETPSRVAEGPAVAIEALAQALAGVLDLTGVSRASVRAVGLDTPGPASADGVISTRGATNFVDAGVARLRRPRRIGRPAHPAGDLQQ